MSNNLTLGPVQILSNDVASLNLAFQQCLDRIDELVGLRGRALIWDRAQVSSPTVASDAVDLGSLTARESLFHMTFFAGMSTGIAVIAPGTTYAEVSTLWRQQVNFAAPTSLQGRMKVSGFGTQSGSDKGVALTDSAGAVICQVEWDGQDEQTRVGDFTVVNITVDTLAQLRVKGSSAEENIVLRHVAVEFRLDAGSSVTVSA